MTALRLTGRIFGGRSLQDVHDVYGSEKIKGSDVTANQEVWRDVQQPLRSEFVLYQDPPSVKLETCTYVDDHLSGHNSKPEAVQRVRELEQMIEPGNFRFKSVIYSGDDVDRAKVLGIVWDPKQDVLFLPVRANHGAKIKGRKLLEDLDLEDLWRSLPETITKREVWRIVQQLYDPLGLASPLLLKSKLCLRSVCIHGCDWDDSIPGELRSEFVSSLQDRAALGNVSFRRSMVPDKPLGLPMVIGFCDASSSAYAAIIYLRWPTAGGFDVVLCCAKSRVAPVKMESIPRLEMLSCLILARLVDTVVRALPFDISGNVFFSDSSCALAQLSSDSVMLNVFNSHRVSEIQQLTSPEEWRWVPTQHNIADLATRGLCTIEDVQPGSTYQEGPSWLRLEQDQWPVKTAGEVNASIPESELNPKMAKLKVMFTQMVDNDFWRSLARRTYRQARRTVSAVLKAANRFKLLLVKKRGVATNEDGGSNNDSSRYYENYTFTNTYLDSVCDLFLTSFNQEKEMTMDAEGKFDSLQPYHHKVQVCWPIVGHDGCFPLRTFTILKMAARGDEALEAAAGGPRKVMKDSPGVVLLSRHNRLAKLILQQCHDELGHGGHRKTLAQSRRYAWITHGRMEAMKVVKNCAACSIEYAKRSSPAMANILPDRVEPSVPFQEVHMDLAGPIEVVKPGVGTRNTKTKYKVWLLIVACRFTQAVFIDVLTDYSTEAVLVGLRKLQAFYNMPRRVTTDRGCNFAGTKRILDELLKDTRMHFEWHLVPTAAHSFVGTVERQVGLVKRVLNKKLAGATVTFNDLLLLCAETARVLNSKPLTYATAGEDVNTWRIISPADLLGGRTNDAICTFETGCKERITKRLENLEELTRQFHQVYKEQLMPELLRSIKWRRNEVLLEPGDVVLVDDSTSLMKKFRLGRVQEVRPGGRTVVAKYKLSDDAAATDNETSARRLLKIDLPKV